MTKPIAVVTGGSRGIGAATCEVLARDGYHVVVHYGSSKEKAEKLAGKIAGDIICADFEKDADIGSMVAEIKNKYGKINLLVNNAGIAECESLEEMTRDNFFKTLQVNLWAQALLTKLIAPVMDTGNIIFTSSVCARVPTPDALAYAASKAGIEAVMRSIAAEFAPKIRVNAVAPAGTYTDMMRQNYTAEDIEWFKATAPMGAPCDPQDIAEMIAFLASNKAKNITGQTFTVDAGMAVR